MNTGAQRFVIRKLDGEFEDVCFLQMECTVPIESITRFPASFWIERVPLQDPIWDTKQVTILR